MTPDSKGTYTIPFLRHSCKENHRTTKRGGQGVGLVLTTKEHGEFGGMMEVLYILIWVVIT